MKFLNGERLLLHEQEVRFGSYTSPETCYVYLDTEQGSKRLHVAAEELKVPDGICRMCGTELNVSELFHVAGSPQSKNLRVCLAVEQLDDEGCTKTPVALCGVCLAVMLGMNGRFNAYPKHCVHCDKRMGSQSEESYHLRHEHCRAGG